MKQFRMTVTMLQGASLHKVFRRDTLEAALVASAQFVGAFCNDEKVKHVKVEEIRPMRESAENFSLAAEALNRVFAQSRQPVTVERCRSRVARQAQVTAFQKVVASFADPKNGAAMRRKKILEQAGRRTVCNNT